MTAFQRLELFLAMLGLPSVGSIAWQFDLRLAGAVLWLLWVVVAALYVWDRFRPADAHVAPVRPAPIVERPPVVDPGQAFLDALGDDLIRRRP